MSTFRNRKNSEVSWEKSQWSRAKQQVEGVKEPLRNLRTSISEETGEHEVEEEGEVWLVSYADMMTLLFGFFVLMYAFSVQKNQKDFTLVRKELARYFGGTDLSKSAAPISDLSNEEQVRSQAALKNRIEEFRASIELSYPGSNLQVLRNGKEIYVALSSQLLFDSGSAQLGANSRQGLTKIAHYLKEKFPSSEISVEGHTDSLPLKPGLPYASNWELSSARAGSVVMLFVEQGLDAGKLRAIGYSDTRKVGQEDAKNRRVAIRVELDVSRNHGND